MDTAPSIIDSTPIIATESSSISSTSWYVASAITLHVVHEGFVTPNYFSKVGEQIQGPIGVWLGNTATVVVFLQPFVMFLEKIGISRGTPIALMFVGIFHTLCDHVGLTTITSKDGGNKVGAKWVWRPASSTALGLVLPVSLYQAFLVFVKKNKLQYLTPREIKGGLLGGFIFTVSVFFGAWDMVLRSRKAMMDNKKQE